MLEKEHWNKMARLDTKLVNVLQGNKIINFGIMFSTEKISFVFLLGKTPHTSIQLYRLSLLMILKYFLGGMLHSGPKMTLKRCAVVPVP